MDSVRYVIIPVFLFNILSFTLILIECVSLFITRTAWFQDSLTMLRVCVEHLDENVSPFLEIHVKKKFAYFVSEMTRRHENPEGGKHGKPALTYKREFKGTPRTHSSKDWSVICACSSCSRKFSQMPYLQMRSSVLICLPLCVLGESECWPRCRVPAPGLWFSREGFFYFISSSTFGL